MIKKENYLDMSLTTSFQFNLKFQFPTEAGLFTKI